MHKFIIVGHPQSGYQEVENLLHECGMGKAKPSRREGLLPDQISETLRQAHGTPALAALTSAEQVEQIGTAPVWHGMAMDLMLGNLDQRFWGWSDPGAIHLLEYWKQLDPTINFVFVYADPQSALVGPGVDDEVSVDAKLSNWQAFNAAMLHFYNRNPKRSVLVQAEQVRQSVRAYLQQLRTQLNAPLQEPPAHLLLEGEDADAGKPGGDTLASSRQPVSDPARQLAIADETDLTRYLAMQCVAEQPIVRELYEELQAVANLPLEGDVRPAARVDLAWAALLQQREALQSQQEAANALQEQLEAHRIASETASKQIDTLSLEFKRLQSELTEQGNTKEENELLLTQLHQVQEELERLFVSSKSQDAALSEATKKLESARAEEHRLAKQLATQSKSTQEAEKRIAALTAELEVLRKTPSIDEDLKEENELLLTQLHQVQEELERYFLENQRLKQTRVPRGAPLYGAADRVKQQLTYRLGATMIERSRSLGGWISMPFALIGTTRRFRADVRARGDEKLPSISKYQDRHEAERIKQHLSYRIGSALLRNVKSPVGWIRLPFAIRREVRAFRQERKNRK